MIYPTRTGGKSLSLRLPGFLTQLSAPSNRLAPLPHPPERYGATASVVVRGPLDSSLYRIYKALLFPSLLLSSALSLWLRPSYRRRSKRAILIEVILGRLASPYSLQPAHEIAHIVPLWIFTGHLPATSLIQCTGDYGYTAAPGWFLPRNHYLVVGLTPLLALTPLLLACLRFAPSPTIPWLCWMVAHNVAGSNVDLFIARLLLSRPPTTYINDVGLHFTLWEPTR